jgi:hypothetical protein
MERIERRRPCPEDYLGFSFAAEDSDDVQLYANEQRKSNPSV